eukprot:Gregarina_sp_Pseudo_9__4453@NODE_460_length_2798_cov_177_469011_g436_i0_p1_GENE_NODE_460_length_2798_cov_177_469011_g436_i0NODE_460_length_2798_cov_177_469011_g436_i0_p1_ORF_typecomplete_len475_score28_12SDF/PF00375_18/5_4e99_NODE_460_length_2798_cov_177_469011_g436_i0671491
MDTQSLGDSAGRSVLLSDDMPRTPWWKLPWTVLRKTSVSFWIFVGLLVGLLLGHFAPDFSVAMKPFSTIFIYMISCLIVPLIFSSLVVGIAAHGEDLKTVGKLAIKCLIYFEVLSTLALALGLIMVDVTQPGVGVSLEGVDTSSVPDSSGSAITWQGELFKIIPESFFAAAAENSVLQIVFCAILFAVALAQLKSKHMQHVLIEWLRALMGVMFGVTALVMNYAPVAVCVAVAATIGANGLGVIVNLSKLVGVLYGSLLLFILGVLYPVTLIAKIPLREFIRHVYSPVLLAFATASSESALPQAMENLERMGIPERIYGFVLPTGYSFNLDGTSLHLTVAAMFCAQAADVHLSISTQIVMLITLMLTSKGVAAVPRVSIVILSATIAQYDIPNETLGLLLGVDAFLDMARTSVNVLGNCLAAVVMARWEGAYPAWGVWGEDQEGKDLREGLAASEFEEDASVSSTTKSHIELPV